MRRASAAALGGTGRAQGSGAQGSGAQGSGAQGSVAQGSGPQGSGAQRSGAQGSGAQRSGAQHRGVVIAPKKTGEATKQEERRRHVHQVGGTSQVLRSHEARSRCSNKANFRCVVPISVDWHRR